MMVFIVLPLLLIIAFVIAAITVNRSNGSHNIPKKYEPEYKRFGQQGEQIATIIIKSVLRDGDYLFTNVPVFYDGKSAELDNVIVNKNGVFIIEVKTYKGHLYGGEDDYEWEKYKDDGYGNTFKKNVKNPIKQVKRQTYILAKYLEYYGAKVWVEGYAFLVAGNSPVRSTYLLDSLESIDNAIHTPGKNRLNAHALESIKNLLSNN